VAARQKPHQAGLSGAFGWFWVASAYGGNLLMAKGGKEKVLTFPLGSLIGRTIFFVSPLVCSLGVG
jgi:hypothetical protein